MDPEERQLREKTLDGDPRPRFTYALVREATLKGRLKKQPCEWGIEEGRWLDPDEAGERCADKKTSAHHPDYRRPLDVQWLCRRHHRVAHPPTPHKPQAMEIVSERSFHFHPERVRHDVPSIIAKQIDGSQEIWGLWLPIQFIDDGAE